MSLQDSERLVHLVKGEDGGEEAFTLVRSFMLCTLQCFQRHRTEAGNTPWTGQPLYSHTLGQFRVYNRPKHACRLWEETGGAGENPPGSHALDLGEGGLTINQQL